ncbi:unnamed protein product [Didymodactylos carnosus]|uniref:Uncharacterized protein n=1 Tax=Didymodactylos carnosus TaxID=1234261 RepID=A0A814NPR3_9BILA|nr:unnamed protein product [Didymodactylos carnosus]CAF1095795.1 unnamed protein product [Didymodactylos carnosus]CAF3713596.1 unnamed protein product [Didymodactylos carnosus]CAF3861133.1 unnamed protein product [Didymodactylos carnosus]
MSKTTTNDNKPSSSNSFSKENLPSDSVSQAYKPGLYRYQELPIEQRKTIFRQRQEALNPCLKESEKSERCLAMYGYDINSCRLQAAIERFRRGNAMAKQDGFPPLEERPIWKKQVSEWLSTGIITMPDELKDDNI